MDQQLYSWKALLGWFLGSRCVPSTWLEEDGSHVLGRTLSELKVADAQATVASDREMILSSIAQCFRERDSSRSTSLESLDNRNALSKCDENIRNAIVDSIEVALGGAAQQTDGRSFGRLQGAHHL